MRRSDREVKDINEIIKIMKKCDVCRLAFNDDDCPYIVPLNFGMKTDENNKITLYFHGALEGRKYELINKQGRASFEMDCSHRLVTDEIKKSCTMYYESVIGRGNVEMLSESEKYDALCRIMRHYHKEDFQFNKDVIKMTNVFKLEITELTAKSRSRKND